MRLLIMGSDNSFGKAVRERFASDHEVKAASWVVEIDRKDSAGQITYVDYKQHSEIQKLVEGVDAILYLNESGLEEPEISEERIFERATLAPYSLLKSAREAGVKRVVLESSLRLFDSYPENFKIDEQWQPRPQPEASALAPYLIEQTCREYAREGPISVIALRFDPSEVNSDKNIALSAIDKALKLPLTVPGYRWQVFHITESDRYITRQARLRLGWTGRNQKEDSDGIG